MMSSLFAQPMPDVRSHHRGVGANKGTRDPFDDTDRSLLRDALTDPDVTRDILRAIRMPKGHQTLRRAAAGKIKSAPWRDDMRRFFGRVTATDGNKLDEHEVDLLTAYRRIINSAPHRAQDLLDRAHALADAAEAWRSNDRDGEQRMDRAIAGDPHGARLQEPSGAYPARHRRDGPA